MASIYKLDYEGAAELERHDNDDELRRWVCNWQTKKPGDFPSSEEWLTIEERKFVVGRRSCVRWIGEIGSDHSDYRRRIEFETGAPPPPTFHRPPLEPRAKRQARQRLAHEETTFDQIERYREKLGIFPPAWSDLVMLARTPWDLLDQLKILELRQEKARLDAMQWIEPMWDIPLRPPTFIATDYGTEHKPKLPPPPRFRRN